MNWLKQNWIQIVLVILILGALFFIKKQNIGNTPLINELGETSQNKSLTIVIKNSPETDICHGIAPYNDCISNNEIWIKNNNTGEEKLLVKSGDISKYPFANSDYFPFSNIYNLHSPVFSLDGKKVYFMSYAWITEDAIFLVDVSTGELHLVSGGNSLEIIDAGPQTAEIKGGEDE